MEVLPKNEILEFHPDTLDAVRKLYGLDKPGAMKEAVDILHRWVQQQEHFMKKDFSRDYLERTIIATKGSVERSKERMDKILTIRNLMPKFFKEFDARCDFEDIKDNISYVLLPKLTDNHERVYLNQTVGKKFSSSMYLNAYRYVGLLLEYARAHDYAGSYYFVVNFLKTDIQELLAKVDLVDLRQGVVAFTEGYGVSLKGIHILVNSKLVDVLVSITKQLLSEKLRKRIHVHKSYDEMFETFPNREIFPEEYGGKERPMKELDAEWKRELGSEEFRAYWKMMLSARTDESLRQADTFNEQYIGMPGTFRTLSVD